MLGTWNYIDVTSYALNTFLLVNHIFKFIPHETTVIIAFVAAGLMWLNFIYWLRIFERTTFYFDLINQTIEDMFWFFTIYVLLIFACGNAVYILNTNRR